ncbi:tetratricopeptide repeat protein [Verrucomicrobiaceae bacterium 5K15]|uniref:Tetratricopeptide repeat protein n=1 Tax=Oceaniferula flava TaxID=2800421 RepID=A0AAE2SFG6_9BACT|nr:tetratricopeptide repeat protein [Oceaniferula flavus]MBK1856022.1 tetratricopeptide repeat protein [Oceaniferula flavus]MBM1137329.1 tetratricopeptide repeat protein [Oceaniferula flavus]
MKTIFFGLTSLLLSVCPLLAQAADAAERIRAKQYPAALKILNGDLAAMAKQDANFTEDQLMLLKARALHLDKKHADAENVCDALKQKFPDSDWRHKASFLKAHSLAARGQYQAALAIYEAESGRLFSEKRKDEVAKSLLEFADLFAKIPAPEDLEAPKPDFQKAYHLYKEVLDLQCSLKLRELAHYSMIRMAGHLQQWPTVVKDAVSYLQVFDPSWRGEMQNQQRLTFQKNTSSKEPGEHRSEVRYRMAEALHRSNQRPLAVRYLDELLSMMEKGELESSPGLTADAAWLKLMAMRAQGGRSSDVELWVETAKEYLQKHPRHLHANSTAFMIPSMLASHGKPEQAISAYQDLLKNPVTVAENPVTLEKESRDAFLKRQENAARKREEASYQIGQLHLQLHQFDQARQAWNQTTVDFPNGTRWADSQKGLVTIDYTEALQAIRQTHQADDPPAAAEKATALLQSFLTKHPLSEHAPQVLFLLGRIPHQLAIEMDEEKNLTPEQREAQVALFKKSIAVWDELLSKYPKTQHATDARELIGLIYEQRLGDLEKALTIYRQTKSPMAAQRRQLLTSKRLIASSPKVFRTDEDPTVSLSLRNVEKVTIRQYWLDLESYFRKARKLGNISELDVDLVEPDKQWDVAIDGFKKYIPIEKQIPVPFEPNKPGVCVVKVEGEGFLSTTVIVRSDIDIAVRSSKDELLAFATNWRREGAPTAGVKLLVADGGKIVATGETGADGVLHLKSEKLAEINDLRVLALSSAGAATCDLDLSRLVPVPILLERAWFNTPQQWYRPGESVQLSGLLRTPANGLYQIPAKEHRQWTLRCVDMNGGKLIHQTAITLNDHGSFSTSFTIPKGLSQARITATLSRTEGDKSLDFHTLITVKNQPRNRVVLSLDFPKTWTALGEKVTGTVTAKYHWGAPVADREVTVKLPNNLKLKTTTNAEGVATFDYDTSLLASGSVASFSVSMPSESANLVRKIIDIDPLGFGIEAELSHATIASGEAFEVIAKTLLPDGKAATREITLEVVKQEVKKADPILGRDTPAELPNAVQSRQVIPATPMRETIVQTHTLTTDAETGLAKQAITLDEGGRFILRIRGKDARGRLVYAESFIEIYGEDSQQKIRLLVDKNKLHSGGEAKIDAWSRLDSPTHALLSIEADKLVEYRVVKLAPGKTPITLKLNERHAPVFRAAMMAMHQRKFYSSDEILPVDRELKVVTQIEGLDADNTIAPGGKLKVNVKVLDGNDQPQDAEVSLSLIDQRDAHSAINHQDFSRSQRLPNFAMGTSCGLRHQGSQKAVDMVARAEERRAMNMANRPLARQNTALSQHHAQAVQQVRKQLYMGEGYFNLGQYDQATAMFQSVLKVDKYNKAARRWLERIASTQSDYYRSAYDQTRAQLLSQVERAWEVAGESQRADAFGGGSGGGANGGNIQRARPASNIATGGLRSGDFAFSQNNIDAILNNPNRNSIDAELDNRNGRGFSNNSYNANWKTYNYRLAGKEQQGVADGYIAAPSLLTLSHHSHQPTLIWAMAQQAIPKSGRDLEIPLPETSGSWKLLSHASTAGGVLGQKVDTLHTRLPYDLHLNHPSVLIEGDQLAPEIVLTRRNTDAAESITLNLRVKAGTKRLMQTKHTLNFAAGESTQRISPKAIEVPKAPTLDFLLTGENKLRIARQVTIRPWGLPVADRASAVLKAGKQSLTLKLPAKVRQQELKLQILPGMHTALRQLALAPQASWCGTRIPFRQSHASGKLLAVAAVISYHRDRGLPDAQMADLITRANQLAAELAVTKNKDGSWPAVKGRSAGDLDHSAMAFEALTLAKKLQLTVDQPTLTTARLWLEKQQSSIASSDVDARATVQYALSCADAADFSTCNRLFRERGKLGDVGKALLAAAFVNLDRPDTAKTLLAAMAGKDKWQSKSTRILATETFVAARALSAAVAVQPKSALTTTLRDVVLMNSGADGFTSDLDRGAALVTLAKFEQQADPADARVSISLNGKKLAEINTDQPKEMANITVDSKLLVEGENTLSFAMEGTGRLVAGATITGFAPLPEEHKIDPNFEITRHRYAREGLSFQGKPLRARGTSPAKTVNQGERVRVDLFVHHQRNNEREVVVIERIPAGFVYEKGSLSGQHSGARVENDHLVVTFDGRVKHRFISYNIIARHPGIWRQPPTLMLPLRNPADGVHGKPGSLTVIGPKEKNPDVYVKNYSERSELAKLHFEQNKFPAARAEIMAIRKERPDWENVENSRMLLWIETASYQPDARLLVESFEILNERSPDLVIPFEKILKVGKAYQQLKEFERGLEVFTATIEAGFAKDTYVGVALEDQGRFLDAVDYQKQLWRLYPDEGAIANAWFALAQQLFQMAPKATSMQPRRGTEKAPTELQLIEESGDILNSFLLATPDSPLADDAAFTLANVLFSLKQFKGVVEHAHACVDRYPKSKHAGSFRYMEALGSFWLRDYDAALKAASEVAQGSSEDKNLAAYITAQIYHAKGQPLEAARWYERVKGIYPDAQESIAYFEQKSVRLDEAKLLKSGEKAEIKLHYRNIKEAHLQIYRVDLMKLYLREKSLSNVANVNLAGIAPKHEMTIQLGDGQDFQDREKRVTLPVKDDGAYLVICRGDYLYTSGLVLITSLKMEVQENLAARSLRVNISDQGSGKYLDNVHVKAIGVRDSKFKSGETDLRGIWKAENITSRPTVIARDEQGRYAFYRSQANYSPVAARQNALPAPKAKPDFKGNLMKKQQQLNKDNASQYEQLRRSKGKGVKAKEAIKK